MRQLDKRVAMSELWGEQCYEFEPGCPCCEAWRQFDLSGEVTPVPGDEVFVLLSYHEHEPVHVYGPFTSSDEAHEWASRQAIHTTYEVHGVRNVKEQA